MPQNNTLSVGAEQLKNRVILNITSKVNEKSQEFQIFMQQNYPWTKRSGTANRSMWAQWDFKELEYTIALGYGVEYGKFLELAHEKKYALTHPTAIMRGPEVLAACRDVIKNLNAKANTKGTYW